MLKYKMVQRKYSKRKTYKNKRKTYKRKTYKNKRKYSKRKTYKNKRKSYRKKRIQRGAMEAGTDAQNDAAQTAAGAGLLKAAVEKAAAEKATAEQAAAEKAAAEKAAAELLAASGSRGAAEGAKTEPPPLSKSGGAALLLETAMDVSSDEEGGSAGSLPLGRQGSTGYLDSEEDGGELRPGPMEFQLPLKGWKGRKGGPDREAWMKKSSAEMGFAQDELRRERKARREREPRAGEGGGDLGRTGSRKRKTPTRFTSDGSESMFPSVRPASPDQLPPPESVSAAAAAPRPTAGSGTIFILHKSGDRGKTAKIPIEVGPTKQDYEGFIQAWIQSNPDDPPKISNMKRTVQRQWVDGALDALEAELRGLDENALRLRAKEEFGLSDGQLAGANKEKIISLIHRKHFFPKPKVHKGHYDFVNEGSAAAAVNPEGSAAAAAAPPRVNPKGTFTEEEMVLLEEENPKVRKIQTAAVKSSFTHADLGDLQYIYIRGFPEENPDLYYRGKNLEKQKNYVYEIIFDTGLGEVDLANGGYDIYIQEKD
jgi:hypothetical protein